MADFKSFGALANAWEKRYKPEKVTEYSLPRAGKIVQKFIRGQHGKVKPKNSMFTSWQKGGRNSPLYDTGALQRAVQYTVEPQLQSTFIFSTNEWLADIHEYGRVIKMTQKQKRYFAILLSRFGVKPDPSKSKGGRIVIPPRMVWRRAVVNTRIQILNTVYDAVHKYLTND